MDKNFFDRNWWKDLGVAIIATTVSIVLTFGTAALVDAHKRKEARRMTALMVLSNIESFIRSMEDHCEELARKDTVSTWLLRLSTEQIQKMDQDTLMDYLRETNRLSMLVHDKTSESIFTNNIETWENLGNFGFIDHVGESFMGINWIISQWDMIIQETTNDYNRITSHPDDFKGKTIPEKLLGDSQVRSTIAHIHSLREWMEYNVYQFREANRKSMWLIGLTEKEVMEFTDTRQRDTDYGDEVADTDLEFNPSPVPDSLYTMPSIKRQQ